MTGLFFTGIVECATTFLLKLPMAKSWVTPELFFCFGPCVFCDPYIWHYMVSGLDCGQHEEERGKKEVIHSIQN